MTISTLITALKPTFLNPTAAKTKNIFTKENELDTFLAAESGSFSVRDLVTPSIIKESEKHIQLGENFVRTLVITNFPSRVKGNWLLPLYRMKGNVNFSYHLEPASGEDMMNYLSKSIRELETRLEEKLSARRERETLHELNSAKRLLDKLTEGNDSTMLRVHLYIHLQAENLDELDQLTQKVRQLCINRGLKSVLPNENMLYGFQSVLPTNSNKLKAYTWRNMDAEAASSLFPFDESEIFTKTGIIKGTNITTGSLVLLDQYKLKNHNEFVIGTSGAGKSFYIAKDMLRHYMRGIKVYIIDPENEYSEVVQKNSGQVINISSMSGTVINPMEILHSNIDTVDLEKELDLKEFSDFLEMDDDEETEDEAEQHEAQGKPKKSLLHQKIQRLKIFFRLLKKDMSYLEASLIESVVIETYKNKGIHWESDFDLLKPADFPILEDLYKTIENRDDDRLNDFKAILETYVYGSESLMFNGITNVNLKNDMISFNLKELEDESDSMAAAMYNVLSYLWDEITKDKTLKRLYVDEAHIMADPDNPRAMKFLFTVYKRIRKYKGGATAATQQIADFFSAVEGSRNYGKAVIGNSRSKLLLGLEETDIDDLKSFKAFKLSEEEENILSSAEQGEGVYIVGSKRVHMEVDHTPQEMKLIDPKKYQELYGIR